MSMQFTKATKKQAKLRLALESPAGFGKTYTALAVATALVEGTGKRIALLDTEGVIGGEDGGGAADKYAHLFDFDSIAIGPPFHPARLIEAIEAAVANDYGVFVGDSFSHFWQGTGGLLQLVDEIARTKYRGDSHRAWNDAGKIQQDLIDAVLRSPIHIIATMRMKKDFVRDTVEKDGREVTRIRAAGTKTVQRDDFDYEFDLVGRFEVPTIMTIAKSRCDTLPPDTVLEKPGAEFTKTLRAWLEAGEANTAIELPTPADKKKLDKLIAELNKADGERDWAEIADKYARREFGHGVGALTKTENVATVTAMGAHLESLIAAAASGANDETAPTRVPEGAAA